MTTKYKSNTNLSNGILKGEIFEASRISEESAKILLERGLISAVPGRRKKAKITEVKDATND